MQRIKAQIIDISEKPYRVSGFGIFETRTCAAEFLDCFKNQILAHQYRIEDVLVIDSSEKAKKESR